MRDTDPHTPEPARPEAQWQRTARRVGTLQRVQLLSLVTIGLVVVLSTLGSGVLFFTSAQQQEERESERAKLVSTRDSVRDTQVDVLRRLEMGETAFDAEGVLGLVAVAGQVEALAATPTLDESAAEREARLDVVRLVEEFSTRLAASSSNEDFGALLTGPVGQALLDEYFASFNAWVLANGESVALQRANQRELVVRSGLAVSALVLLMTTIGILIWWRVERARERVVASTRAESRRFDSLVSNASDLMVVIDEAGIVDYCSPSVKRVLGRPMDEVVRQPLKSLVHPEDTHRLQLASSERLADNEVSEPVELRLRRVDGTWLHAETLIRNLARDEAVRGFVLNCRDVSDRKEVEDQLAHQAFHDPLTGLANRVLFQNRLSHALERQVSDHSLLGVLVLDLDDFKTVNDSMGHPIGDELLNVVGQRLLRAVRPGDTAARLGGDEYAVVLEGLAGPAAARVIADRISQAIREPVSLEGKEVVVTASVGIAMAPRHGDDPETLLRLADIAMYAAKATRGGKVLSFDPSMETAIDERMRLTVDLNRAVDAGDQFSIAYQPIVDLETEDILGVEALLRWQHPTDGEILPGRFIPLAEQTGLIIPIGEYVLSTACAAGAAWNANPDRTTDLTISVNVSPRQLEDPSFATTVGDALKRSGLPSRCLLLEVTESALMGDVTQAVEMLTAIKELGVRIAIDDFGTGYSSLSQLGRLPVDMVKIDKAFIDALSGGTADADITGVIVQLGAVLDLQTVAEGIELVEQVSDLQQLECHAGQGFFFASPMKVQEITKLLADPGQAPVTELVPGATDEGER